MLDVGQPAAAGIGSIENGPRADLRKHSCVQWIGRDRHEDVIARFGQGGERQLDAFGRPGGNHDPVRRDRHSPPLAVGGNRFPRRRNADRRRIAILPASDRCFDGVEQVRRSLEAEDDGIADVEISDLPSGCLNLLRLRHDIADCVDKAPDS